MIAVCHIKTEPSYRRTAFEAGLRRLGYQLVFSAAPRDKRDLLVIWNRQLGEEVMADTWERHGGTVLVAENGYIGQDGDGRQLYAIAVHGHNGSGWFPVGTEDRLSALHLDIRPWVAETGHVLVCGQRGIGSKTMASPPAWDERTAQRLRAMGEKLVKVRKHPGRYQPTTSLEEDLAGASRCVIWSSSSGVKALVAGVPVVYCAPSWICADGAGAGLKHLAHPPRDDAKRITALHRMSHAQWRVDEIERGEPFARILDRLEEATW